MNESNQSKPASLTNKESKISDIEMEHTKFKQNATINIHAQQRKI